MDPDKRKLRKLKREVKRAGGKRRRRHLKRDLAENPEDAPFSEYDFRGDTSTTLNGLDRDATRQRTQPEEETREGDA
jgi:hypothetical protein